MSAGRSLPGQLPSSVSLAGRRLPRGVHYVGDLRSDLLAAALQLVSEHGPDALTVRAVAARVGVSHAAPARWYPTRGHLLTAVAAEAFALLVAEIAAAQAGVPEGAAPEVTVQASALAYLRFARHHPGHFAVMWREDLLIDDPALQAAGEASLRQLEQGVERAIARGWAAGCDPEAVADLVWSTTHGLATLRASGPYHALDEVSFVARAKATIAVLAASLGSSPTRS